MFFLRAKSAMLACVDGKQMRLEAIKNYHLRILIRTTKLLRHWIRRASMWEWASGWFEMGGYPKCPGSCCFCFAARENKYRFHPLSPGTRFRTHTHITLNGCQTKEVNGGKKKPGEEKKTPTHGWIPPLAGEFPPPPTGWQRQTTLTKLTPVFRTLGSQECKTAGLQDFWAHPSSAEQPLKFRKSIIGKMVEKSWETTRTTTTHHFRAMFFLLSCILYVVFFCHDFIEGGENVDLIFNIHKFMCAYILCMCVLFSFLFHFRRRRVSPAKSDLIF